MTFACQFGRHTNAGLTFGTASAGDLFLRKIIETFRVT